MHPKIRMLYIAMSQEEFSAKFPRGCCHILPIDSQFTPKKELLASGSLRCVAMRKFIALSFVDIPAAWCLSIF